MPEYGLLHRELLEIGRKNDRTIVLSAPADDTDYPAFHARVEALEDLRGWGLARGRIQIWTLSTLPAPT
jgi:hypothetical protein